MRKKRYLPFFRRGRALTPSESQRVDNLRKASDLLGEAAPLLRPATVDVKEGKICLRVAFRSNLHTTI